MKAIAFYSVALTIVLTAGPVTAHDWYSDLADRNGRSCCNDVDCHRVGHRYSPENGHEVEIRDQWITVDPRIILPQSSPDGLAHACYTPTWWSYPAVRVYFTIHCVILGGMS
jgi:hypothetical protein